MILAKFWFSIAWLAWLIGTPALWLAQACHWIERKATMAGVNAKMRAPGVACPLGRE